MAYWMHLTPSSIDNILKRESFTLEELLEEEDLVQECKCCNQALMDYLVKPETMDALLKLMTRPEVGPDHPKAKLYSKRAADVLLCEINAVSEGIVGTPGHLTTLLEFLEQPLTGDCGGDLSMAGHFCRVLLHLCDTHPEEMLEALSTRENVYELLLAKLSFDSFKDLFLPLLLAQSDDSSHLVSCWLWEKGVVKSLLEILKTTDDLPMHLNAAALLSETAEAKPQVIAELSQPDNMKLLVSLLEGDNDEKLANVLVVLSGVVAQGKDAVDEFAISPASSDDDSSVGMIAGAMETIAQLLDRVPEREIEMPGHTISPVLGKMRLKCMEFLALVVRAYKTGGAASSIHSGLIEANVLPRVIQLLFDHPWHNILHIHIDDVIQHCLYSTNDTLRTALIDQGCLHTRLAEALQASQETRDAPEPTAAESEESFEPNKSGASNASNASNVSIALTRSCQTGNLGCIVALAQALSEAADNHDCLSSRIESDSVWNEVVTGVLAQEIQKQSVELGRAQFDPMSQMGDICSSSSEDEQHYIQHSSSDDDEEPAFFGDAFQGGLNNIKDAFANTDTTYVDDSNAWNTQQISESEWTSSDWVAGLNSEVRNDSGSSTNGGFSMVEDPWADQAPEEIEPQEANNDWGAGPAWEANFGGAGPAWNACFETSPETVEGSMIEEAPAPDEEATEMQSEGVGSETAGDVNEIVDERKDCVPEEVELPEEVPEEVEDPSVGDV